MFNARGVQPLKTCIDQQLCGIARDRSTGNLIKDEHVSAKRLLYNDTWMNKVNHNLGTLLSQICYMNKMLVLSRFFPTESVPDQCDPSEGFRQPDPAPSASYYH